MEPTNIALFGQKMNSRSFPMLDIALATYNGEPYLLPLLRSISQQTYTNWRLIVGDDCSTDRTIDIIHSFAATHQQKVIILPASNKRAGVTENFSRILHTCNSPYVLLADQDDIWAPNKIETQLKLMHDIEDEEGSLTPLLVHTDATVCDENGRLICDSLWHYQNLCPKYGLTFSNLLVQNVITGCTVLMNQPLLNLALPVPKEAIMHDWWLALVASFFGKISYSHERMLAYRQHSNNTIGAKKWGFRHLANQFLASNGDWGERINNTRRQAAAFKSIFKKNQSCDNQKKLDAYLRIGLHPLFVRQFFAAQNRFHKCGIFRTLGFYLSL